MLLLDVDYFFSHSEMSFSSSSHLDTFPWFALLPIQIVMETMQIWPYCRLITFLVIHTYSFKMAAIWYFLQFAVNRQLISEIYDHFLENHILFTSHSFVVTHGPLRLSILS